MAALADRAQLDVPSNEPVKFDAFIEPVTVKDPETIALPVYGNTSVTFNAYEAVNAIDAVCAYDEESVGPPPVPETTYPPAVTPSWTLSDQSVVLTVNSPALPVYASLDAELPRNS
jgi:hypothetical protein